MARPVLSLQKYLATHFKHRSGFQWIFITPLFTVRDFRWSEREREDLLDPFKRNGEHAIKL